MAAREHPDQEEEEGRGGQDRTGVDDRTIGSIRTATWGPARTTRDRKKHTEQIESYLARKGNHDFRLNARMDDALGSRNFLIGGGPLCF